MDKKREPAGNRPPFRTANEENVANGRGFTDICDSTNTHAASHVGLTFARYAIDRLNTFDDLVRALEELVKTAASKNAKRAAYVAASDRAENLLAQIRKADESRHG